MITRIYKGDATNANGRTILINLPDEDMTGLSVVFEFYGHRFVDNAPQRGGSMRVDFSAEETSVLPLGTHFAKLGLIRNDIEYTASATIPVCVSDDVAEVYGGDAANINLEMRLCSGIPDLSDIDHAPNTSYALADAFRALLNKLQSGVCISLALVCAFCHGAAPATAPIGAIPFNQLVVTNQTEAFAPMSHVENQLNPHRVTAKQVGATTPVQVSDMIQDAVRAISYNKLDNKPTLNGETIQGAVVLTGEDIKTSANNSRTVSESIAAKADEFTEWVCTPALPSGWFIRRTEGGIGQDPGYQLWNNEGWVEDFYASYTDDILEFQFPYAPYTATRKRVLRTGDAGAFTPEMATNVARAVAQPHIDNRNNPHGVTASQVGAIPQNLNSPYTISLGEFPLFFSSTVGGSESPEMSVSSDGVWISGLNVDGQLVKGGEDVATVPFVISASNNLARVRLDIVLQTYPTQHYEIQLNGVKQTFDQVAELASSRDCYIKRANGIYHPTYISAEEVMFDCVGTIHGLIETRRIHMVASTGAVTIGDLKVIADRDWVESLPTTYTNFSGTAFVALNQSVQTVTTHGEQIAITMPNAVAGGTRDFCVYINNEGSTDSPLWLPSGTYYGDEDCTNAVKSGMVTGLYFTEMSGGKFMIGRKELVQISVSH